MRALRIVGASNLSLLLIDGFASASSNEQALIEKAKQREHDEMIPQLSGKNARAGRRFAVAEERRRKKRLKRLGLPLK